MYGPYNLRPLRGEIERWLEACIGRSDVALSQLPIRLYL